MPRRVIETGRKRLVSVHWGDSKTGKTDCALSFPEPIYFGNLNLGVDPLLLGPRWKGRDVEIEDFGVIDPDDFEAIAQELDNFKAWFLSSIAKADKYTGTVVVDTTSELWEYVRVVKLDEARRERFGKQSKAQTLDQLKNSRLDYGPVNLYMRSLMQLPLRYPSVNACYLATCKSKYTEAGQETTEKLYAGFGALTAIADVTCKHFKDGRGFHALIERCRHNTDQEGLTYDNDYVSIYTAVFAEEP